MGCNSSEKKAESAEQNTSTILFCVPEPGHKKTKNKPQLKNRDLNRTVDLKNLTVMKQNIQIHLNVCLSYNKDDSAAPKHTDLSSTSSSSLCRSHAMYSRAMSVIRGHQDRSRLRSLRRFSATSSTPSSVILEQPERLRAVRLGRLCTMLTTP